jgi:hypothetical protein
MRHFWSWVARARGDEGHIAFAEARRLYQSYVASLQKPFDHLSNVDFEAAIKDSDLARAEELYTKARLLAAEEKRSDNVAIADYQLGLLYHLQGRLSEARQRLQSAVGLLESSINVGYSVRSTLSGCFYHLGIISMRVGDRAEAERLLHKSLEIDEEETDLQGIALCKGALETIESWPFEPMASHDETTARPDEAEMDSKYGVEDGAAGRPADFGAEQNFSSTGSGFHDDEREDVSEPSGGRGGVPPLSGEGDASNFTMPGTTNVIWLLSHSVEANDIYMEELENRLASGVAAKVTIQRCAFGSAGDAESVLQHIASDERLCGAILVLEAEALHNTEYLHWAELCVNRVASVDDFRLFVGATSTGVDLESYEQSAGPRGCRLIDELAETVQFITGDTDDYSTAGTGATGWAFLIPGPNEICEAVRSYLHEVDSIRSAALWRTLRLSMARILGRFAVFAQLAAFLAVCMLALALLFLGEDAPLNQWTHSHLGLAGLFAGIVLFPLNTVPLFFVLRGARAMSTLPQRRPDLMRLFIILMSVSFGLSYLIGEYELPAAWIILGVCAGAILDHARRLKNHAHRARISLLNCLRLSEQAGFPGEFLTRGTRIAKHPLWTPLFPAIRPRVFISYGRRLSWSEETAHGLHRMLARQGTVSFLDREGIGAGSSWRTVLNRCISDADVFVSVIEEEAKSRRWVAAETIAAVVGRAVSGSPQIITLIPAHVKEEPAQRGLAVFQTLLRSSSSTSDDRSPRVLRVGRDSLQMIASDLHPSRYETGSVFPHDWALGFKYLTIPIVSVGPLSAVLGLPAALIFYLEYWGKTSLGSLLAGWHLLGAACILGGYMTGFCARLVASTAFEVRHDKGRAMTVAHAIACGGLGALSLLWCQNVSPLQVGWSITLGFVGWYLAGFFLQNVGLSKPGLFVDGWRAPESARTVS